MTEAKKCKQCGEELQDSTPAGWPKRSDFCDVDCTAKFKRYHDKKDFFDSLSNNCIVCEEELPEFTISGRRRRTSTCSKACAETVYRKRRKLKASNKS